jgi:hypothetical protein
LLISFHFQLTNFQILIRIFFRVLFLCPKI